ncbi:hypothetical protein V1639_01770 [Pseudarthrobacter sp. J75]|uniref:hypothetical protein n=1 Tax=unclassified Pseudarthrobacter TaxID=2647000 RepID=UPI002E81BF84|nr:MULTISPECIES: hypothetical protein [unclassified Pseudarthrobacter]MEE2521680.1 hypothetical protein [Pseudarthrobacter sp. J47]MEE2527757.1 hypothetical protein [Pseudarthrobacter sp. J75]
MKSPRTLAHAAGRNTALPAGPMERFAGYGIMGVTFSSGHVLALRRFAASSIGPPYNAVWLRDPAGKWTIFSTVAPGVSCARYFGSGLEQAPVAKVSVHWDGPASFTVRVEGPTELTWDVELTETAVTRLMSGICGAVPEKLWRNTVFLSAMGLVAGPMMQAGKIGLTGKVPNRQSFQARPQRIWFVSSSRARLDGKDLGNMGPLPLQDRLGDFWIPQRGIFMIGTSLFDVLDPQHHILTE